MDDIQNDKELLKFVYQVFPAIKEYATKYYSGGIQYPIFMNILRNKYQHKTTRNAVRKLRASESKSDAEKLFPVVATMIDKLAKTKVIHSNKAANLKSGLQLLINKM